MSQETGEKPALVDYDQPTARPPAEAATPVRVPERIETVAIGVGLGPSAPGSLEELALVDALEATARASTLPKAEVRRLRAGAGDPRQICRERRDDLIVTIDYFPDREDPVVATYDCLLDRALGVRSSSAAREPGLVKVLWDEHRELVRRGVEERRAGLGINPKVRTGLIAGGAILAIGTAVALIVASALRTETAVITVGP
ncbi:MAG: hypothetical protein R3A51_12695 [Nannocystaceae bacterium]